MAHGDSPVILDISLWESLKLKNQALFPIVIGRILVGMIAALVWGGWVCIQRRLTAECDLYQCAMPCMLPLRQLGKSALWRKMVNRDRTKVMVDHVVSGSRDVFRYCLGPYIDIDIDIHQLWGKMAALVGPFPYGHCIYIHTYIRVCIQCITNN